MQHQLGVQLLKTTCRKHFLDAELVEVVQFLYLYGQPTQDHLYATNDHNIDETKRRITEVIEGITAEILRNVMTRLNEVRVQILECVK